MWAGEDPLVCLLAGRSVGTHRPGNPIRKRQPSGKRSRAISAVRRSAPAQRLNGEQLAMSTVADIQPQGDSPVSDGEVLVEVKNLKMYFPVTSGLLFQRTVAHIKAVDDISFSVRKGETLGLVGESGCGKTTTGRCILQLYRPTGGQVLFEGRPLAGLNTKEMRSMRREMQVIFHP